jgi:hypothetical protein
MPDRDIFDENKGTNEEPAAETTNPEAGKGDEPEAIDQLLKNVVNENGEPKYKTIDELAKGAANAQDHIRNLETELKELREKGNASDKIDELLEAVKSKGSGQGEEASTMKPEDVLGIVKDYISDAKAAESRETNIKTVTSVFKDRYGADASEKLYGKAADLGFSNEEINRLITTNPKAALKVLGEDQPKSAAADPVGGVGSVSTAHFQGKPADKPVSVMGLSSSKELTDAWKASQERTLERLGLK